MKLHSSLLSTSAAIFSSALCLALAGCGGSGGGSGGASGAENNGNGAQQSPNGGGGGGQQPGQAGGAGGSTSQKVTALAFNGFAGEASIYQNKPLNLAEDLSAVEISNLYDYKEFVNAIDKQKNKLAKAVNYKRMLPKSEIQINTGNTILDPGRALKSSVRPSATNPVFLYIPAGKVERPEAPFFPQGTEYSAVLVSAPQDPKSAYGPILSLEAGSNPQKFGAFAHEVGKTFKLRTYDKASKVEQAENRDLLTQAATPATIQARFVSLTADDLSNDNINLISMDVKSNVFIDLGFSSGKELLAATKKVFPKLYDANSSKTVFNENYGVFCLGGKNKFQEVELKHQTFLYPQSAKDKNTQIRVVKVSNDSGIITESGKYIEIGTIAWSGRDNGDMKLIAVLKDQVSNDDPILKVGSLNNITDIKVTIGFHDPSFKLQNTGMTLLSCDDDTLGFAKVTTEDAHLNGNVYTASAEIKDKKVVLTKVEKKSGLGAGSPVALGLLSHDSRTQGINVNTMYELLDALDPMTAVQSHLGDMTSALNQHALSISGSVNASNHYSAHVSESLSISAGTSSNYMVSGLHLSHGFGGVKLASTVYGAHSAETKDTGFGIAFTASKPMAFHSTHFVPSLSIGYDSFAFSGTSLHARDIHVNISDAVVNSVYARAMSNMSFTSPEGVATTFGFGIEARNGSFGRGNASTDQTSVSMNGESVNGIYSVAEASFATQSSKVSISLCNFNQFQLQFGFND